MNTLASQMHSSQLMVKNLLNPAAYVEHKTSNIHLKQTHSAWIILTGEYAYKIKKPVNFGFLDFSTLAKRKLSCEKELLLNQRFAPNIYVSVEKIFGNQAEAFIAKSGSKVIDYAVKMRQFPANNLLIDLAKTKLLTKLHIDQLINLISKLHLQSDKAKLDSIYGNPEQIRFWMEDNFRPILKQLKEDNQRKTIEDIQIWASAKNIKLAPIFLERKENGFIRDCHGDLHLANITLINGLVTPFDCIEFNDELRWIDVINEIAFLIMDLNENAYSELANRFLNGYLQRTGDYQGLQLLSYYLTYRAVVRAKVALLRRSQLTTNSAEYQQTSQDYFQYIQFASISLNNKYPKLFITTGLSGSGKSTLASLLGEKLGLIQIRSDVERKRLAGIQSQQKTQSDPNQGLYTKDKNKQTYLQLIRLAELVIDAGFSVVLDATFLELKFRQHAHQLADKKQVPFAILYCHAPQTILQDRIVKRETEQLDASEATLDVLEYQQSQFELLTEKEKKLTVKIDTNQKDFLDNLLKHEFFKVNR